MNTYVFSYYLFENVYLNKNMNMVVPWNECTLLQTGDINSITKEAEKYKM